MRIKIFAAALVLFPVVALAQSPPPPAKPDTLRRIQLPGLDQFMGVVRANHAKLWLAGEVGNWELAAYKIADLRELLSQAQTLVPTYRALPVKQMVDDTITTLAGSIAELEKAVRYFFILMDSHDLLLAGLPAYSRLASMFSMQSRDSTQS